MDAKEISLTAESATKAVCRVLVSVITVLALAYVAIWLFQKTMHLLGF